MLGVVRHREVNGTQVPTSLQAFLTTHLAGGALHQPHFRPGSAFTSLWQVLQSVLETQHLYRYAKMINKKRKQNQLTACLQRNTKEYQAIQKNLT